MHLYIGNLSPDVTEEDLKNMFSEYGNIASLKIVTDNYSGSSKGFGFIELPSKAEGQKAIKELNSMSLKGKKIAVNEAFGRPDTKPAGTIEGYESSLASMRGNRR